MEQQHADRSRLLLVLDKLDLGFEADERRDYWAMHDLLTKLARSYQQATGEAQVYLTKKDQHLLAQERHAAKFERVWQASGTSGKESCFRLNADFEASVSRRWAVEMQRRAAHQAKQERRAEGLKEQRSGAAKPPNVIR